MNFIKITGVAVLSVISVPLIAMQSPELPIQITRIENRSPAKVTIVGSGAARTWNVEPGRPNAPVVQLLNIALDDSRSDLDIISGAMGSLHLKLVGDRIQLGSPKGQGPLLDFSKYFEIIIKPNGFINLTPGEAPVGVARPISLPATSMRIVSPASQPIAPMRAVAPGPQPIGFIRAPGPQPAAPSTKRYAKLADFILDDHPRQLTKEESMELTADYENIYMDREHWVDTFWIPYDDLRNEDGSPLSLGQRKVVVEYLKKNSQHADDNAFRFANNNYEVLGGPAGQNPVWKLMHTYLRRLGCLVLRLHAIRNYPCPANKAQLAGNR